MGRRVLGPEVHVRDGPVTGVEVRKPGALMNDGPAMQKSFEVSLAYT